MGFILGSAALSRQPNPKTLTDVVDSIMTSNGIPAPGSVTTSPNKHTIVATSSVNRALSRIWSAAQWDWRVVWINFRLEDMIMFYPLPDDFEWFCTPPTSLGNRHGLQHISYEGLISAYPDLAWATETLRGETGIIDQAQMRIALEERSYYGKPRYWGFKGNEMFVFEIPTEDDYDDTMTLDLECLFSMSYYGAYRDLTADDDVISIPANLNDVVFFLANAYFKQAFEYPDFSADEQRGERFLNLAVNRNKMLHPEGTYSHFTTRMSPWGPYYGV